MGRYVTYIVSEGKREVDDTLDKLEPAEACFREAIALTSIAISLKRIADIMEEFLCYKQNESQDR